MTLATILNDGDATALIEPGSPPLEVSYKRLRESVQSLQKKLAGLGIQKDTPVSIALPNSYAFIVAFLAITWQRGIAAPLNPAYKQQVRILLTTPVPDIALLSYSGFRLHLST